MNCYNCGRPVSDKSQIKTSASFDDVLQNHAEHVPAKCFYVDAKEEQKKNRITVPSCFTCNNTLSGIDDELRNMLGVGIDTLEGDEILIEKSVRALVRKNKWHEKVQFNEDRTVGAVSFDANKVYTIYRKNFKALIYHEYGILINDDFKIAVLFDGFKMNSGAVTLSGGRELFEKYVFDMTKLLMDMGKWECSGDKDIFEYGILPFSFNEQKHVLPEKDPQKAVTFLMMQVYHQKIESIVVATNTKRTSLALAN